MSRSNDVHAHIEETIPTPSQPEGVSTSPPVNAILVRRVQEAMLKAQAIGEAAELVARQARDAQQEYQRAFADAFHDAGIAPADAEGWVLQFEARRFERVARATE